MAPPDGPKSSQRERGSDWYFESSEEGPIYDILIFMIDVCIFTSIFSRFVAVEVIINNNRFQRMYQRWDWYVDLEVNASLQVWFIIYLGYAFPSYACTYTLHLVHAVHYTHALPVPLISDATRIIMCVAMVEVWTTVQSWQYMTRPRPIIGQFPWMV
jgi:hypothetical protein